VAEPATRRMPARSPPVPAGGSRAPNGAGSRCTSGRRNAHKTEHGDERKVVYPWHPWAGCRVRVHEVIEKSSGPVLRQSPAESRPLAGAAGLDVRPGLLPLDVDGAQPERGSPGPVRPSSTSRVAAERRSQRAAIGACSRSSAAKESCGRKNGGDADVTPPRSRELSRSSPPIRPRRLGSGRDATLSVLGTPPGKLHKDKGLFFRYRPRHPRPPAPAERLVLGLLRDAVMIASLIPPYPASPARCGSRPGPARARRA
jgi:hypothetical protein